MNRRRFLWLLGGVPVAALASRLPSPEPVELVAVATETPPTGPSGPAEPGMVARR